MVRLKELISLAVYHYKFLTEDWNMIEGKLKSKTDDNILGTWKTKDSAAPPITFGHTGKWVFSSSMHMIWV